MARLSEKSFFRSIPWGFALTLVLLGAIIPPALSILTTNFRRGDSTKSEHRQVLQGIQEMGDLVSLSAVMKDIGTITEPPKWYKARSKKMMLICEFELEYRFNLRDAQFLDASDGTVTLQLPPCRVKNSLLDVVIYDEQDGEYLPWPYDGLIKDTITTAERNRMLREAKQNAMSAANNIDTQMLSRAEHSAKKTLQILAKAIGLKEELDVQFRDASESVRENVDGLTAGNAGT
jgi:hypothetical protein